AGSAHLRAPVKTGLEIIESLRGHTTGYAVPQYVIDAPGGGGKVPINPDYIVDINEERILIRNYEGKLFEYPLGEDTIQISPRVVVRESPNVEQAVCSSTGDNRGEFDR